MKKYRVKPGYSINTKVGIAHNGAIITKEYFEDQEAGEKFLADSKKVEPLFMKQEKEIKENNNFKKNEFGAKKK